MKVVENIPQNARNCIISKNFLEGGEGGHAPKNPRKKGSQFRCSRHDAYRHVYPKSQFFKSWAPLLRNPAYASGTIEGHPQVETKTSDNCEVIINDHSQNFILIFWCLISRIIS